MCWWSTGTEGANAPTIAATCGAHIPQAFTTIVHRALSASIEARFPSTREMARQIGTTLKKVQLRRDLHTVLSRSVLDARASLGLTGRTQPDVSEATPIAEIASESTRTAHIPTVDKPFDRLRGLRHYLPFFGRKRG